MNNIEIIVITLIVGTFLYGMFTFVKEYFDFKDKE